MKYLCCILFAIMCHAAQAQDPYLVDDENLGPIEEGKILSIMQRRQFNREFLQQTLNYAPLSYVSPTFCDLGSPKDWYILSADIIPQFVIGGDWMKFPIHLTPRYKVRIFHDDEAAGDRSAPVRTPSFMPGATIYIPFQRARAIQNQSFLQYFGASFFHHSNGQDGAEFDEQGSVNLYNGNFSTNFAELAYHFRTRRSFAVSPAYPGEVQDAPYRDFFGGVGYELHINTTSKLDSLYGDYRLNFTTGLIWVKLFRDLIRGRRLRETYLRESFRLVANATVIGGDRGEELSTFSRRINLDVSGYWRIPSSPNASLFASAGYYGSDTYNIYFEQHYFYFRIGIAMGFFVSPAMIGLKRNEH